MEHTIWEPKIEQAEKEILQEIQLRRLKRTVGRCYENVPFYTRKFNEIGLKPEHIKTLSDIRHIPFTT
ncbi:MAG: hypothetical protein ACRCUS_01480, partial [Anaerovoracaceae bacterium]